jgi:hypothetical protein
MDESKRSPHLVTCGCGAEIWSEDAEELLALVEAHIRDAHPDLVGTLSPLELAEKARRGSEDCEDLLALAAEHVRVVHPELVGTLPPLELARPVDELETELAA